MIGWIVAAMATGLASCFWAELRRARVEVKLREKQLSAALDYLEYYMREANREYAERLRWEKAYGESLPRGVE